MGTGDWLGILRSGGELDGEWRLAILRSLLSGVAATVTVQLIRLHVDLRSVKRLQLLGL